MAKTTGPLMSMTASGTVGHTLTMLRQHGRNIAKKKGAPTGRPSAAQVARRALYALCVAGWNALSPAEKLAWKPNADAARITPFNAYMAAALRAGSPVGVTVWDSGATAWDAGTTAWD